MKRSSLKKVPYLQADEKDRKFVSLYGHPYLAKPECVTVDGEKILILNIYEQSNLQKNMTAPSYRVFQGKKQFVIELIIPNKWSVVTLKQLVEDYGSRPQVVIRKACEENLIKRFFRQGKTDERAIALLYEKQLKIKEQENDRNRKKKEKRNGQVFRKVKPFSEAFVRWLDDQALYKSQYIFYDYTRKKRIQCICSHCKTEFELDRSIPRHNKAGSCPICKRPATFKAKGKLKKWMLTDWGEAVKLEKLDEGILIRHVTIHRDYIKDKPETWKVKYHEDYRALLKKNGKVQYFKKVYCGYNLWRWNSTYLSPYFHYTSHFPYTVAKYDCQKNMTGVLYTRNLKKCLSGTVFQYSGLDLYGHYYHPKKIAVKKYLEAYLEVPQLEYFVKSGLYQISSEIVWGQCNRHINLKAKGLIEALQISREELQILRKYDLSSSYVEVFQKMKECGVNLTETEKKNFPILYDNNHALLERNARASVRKITSYLAKQMERYHGYKGYRLNDDLSELSLEEKSAYKNLGSNWLDYLRWAEEMGHDTKSKAVLFPKNLEKAHDQMYKKYQEFQKKEEKKKIWKMRKVTNQLLREEAELLDGKIENEEYIFMIPRKWQDLRQEGDMLGHCVGSYVEHIAKKRCSVYFVRKKEEPEKPYYTVECRDGQVIQCQGKSRSVPTKKVEDFLAYATKEMRHLKGMEEKAA